MKHPNYKPRVIDAKVEEYLSAFGAVCIEGPKWCGKTWTSSHHSKSEIYIGDPANNFQNRRLAELSPVLVLEGDTPRLIDEGRKPRRSGMRCDTRWIRPQGRANLF